MWPVQTGLMPRFVLTACQRSGVSFLSRYLSEDTPILNLTQGKPLGHGDLAIITRDAKGCIVCPVSITYSIFAVDCDEKHVLMTQPKEKPRSSGHGCYQVHM